ncbi:T9SS type A sorting domain-containing protein [Psychroserpens sp. S379A]|uniref:T9SS type A sorting domain-containing protein n=1 Tax=Psychroserpens sp. S379A TaxID=3415137 RepID=UPI003C7BE43E
MLKQLLFLCSVFCLMNINAQVANQPTPLELCDDELSDGFTLFDLYSKDSEVLGTQSEVEFHVSYHLTEQEAGDGFGALESSYVNSTNPQTIYVRIEDYITGYSDTTTLTLRVLPNPAPGVASNIVICDDVSNDGFAIFDLTINDLQILNGEIGNSISYFNSESDALFDSNAIADPTMYININAYYQTIYARLENDVYGCFAITSFDLIVNPVPISIVTSDYILCSGESLIIDSGVDANNFSISWFYQGVLISGETNPTLNVNQAGTYTLELLDELTFCSSLTDIIVTEVSCVDTDSDGVIDADEDLNSNGNLDDDDTDLDGIPNYLDDDDDGDNVDTIDEITNPNGRMALHSFIDTDLDTIENYLDNDDDGDLVLTIDEDYNNNGDPTDDDTNMNNVPDYLDADVALSVTDYIVSNFSLFPNPANDVLNIKLNNISNANLRVYDIQGKLVIERPISNEQNLELNVSNLQSGLYFVKLNTSTKEMVKKLIIE